MTTKSVPIKGASSKSDGRVSKPNCTSLRQCPCGDQPLDPPARLGSILGSRPVRTRVPGGVARREGGRSPYADGLGSLFERALS